MIGSLLLVAMEKWTNSQTGSCCTLIINVDIEMCDLLLCDVVLNDIVTIFCLITPASIIIAGKIRRYPKGMC